MIYKNPHKIMNNALIIGGGNGIGMAIALELADNNTNVTIVDRSFDPLVRQHHRIVTRSVNLLNNEFSFLKDYRNINTLVFTAGFGRVAHFNNIVEKEIDNSFQVNTISVLKTLHFFFERMKQPEVFRCAVLCSIAGLVSSPLFTLYGSTKSALCSAIESLNIELEMAGTSNRILNVSPGSIKGTCFNGGDNNLSETCLLAKCIISEMENCKELYIPQYDETYCNVLARYHSNAHQFGLDSYRYKKENGRISLKPQLKIGYLSGTFDLFHIGHLNLLRRAKQYCDYLVVGVHRDASHKGKQTFVPYEERVEILQNITYVDKVIPSEKEDCDIYLKDIVRYDYLFVGSDYKGTVRFNRYEEIFADKGVQIVYFPYTKGTSSTQLRKALSMCLNENTDKL